MKTSSIILFKDSIISHSSSELIVVWCGLPVDSIRLQELGQALQSPLSVVFGHLVGVFLVEANGREAPDTSVAQFIDGGVHFGHNHVLVVLQRLGQLVPDWAQLFAVTTPRCIKLHQDVFALVLNNFVKVAASQVLHPKQRRIECIEVLYKSGKTWYI